MKRTELLGICAFLLVCCAGTPSLPAQEPIRFARTPDISPDGRHVAFSYLGDLWIVESIGGIARPLTMHEAHDIAPAFSPDGRWIAFSSNRQGSYDVYVSPVVGGKPRRITFDSASEQVLGWSPDSKHILFSSTRGISYPMATEIYTIPFEGGREKQLTRFEAKQGSLSPQGDRLAFVRGPGAWYRRGYRGSSNDDIWICGLNGESLAQITSFQGQDNYPMWSADGQSLYYVSEHHGSPANIVRVPIAGSAQPIAITSHGDEAVRAARMSANREWIVYECGTDLWVMPTGGGSPRKIAIEVHADDKSNVEKVTTFTEGMTEYAVSPDERHVAFAVQGELFVMPISGGKATRMTDSPANDRGIAWAPDGKRILYISDAKGFDDIYTLESDDSEQKAIGLAKRYKSRQLTSSAESESGLSFSPDGKRVAFLRKGRLWTMAPDGTEVKALVNEPQVFDYDWSPDSKHIVFGRKDGSFANDLYIIPSLGGEAKNITRYATSNSDVTWSLRGKRIAFLSERRRNEATVFTLPLQKPLGPGQSSATNEIDWDEIHLRAEQASPMHAEEAAISPDGTRVAFRGVSQGSEDLWMASVDGSRVTRLTSGGLRPTQIVWSKAPYDLIYFRDRTGSLRAARGSAMPADLARLSGSSSFEAAKISFQAKMTIRRDDLLGEMFEQSWRALHDAFYDPQFHGIDWKLIRDRYKPLVRHTAMKEDFYALVSLMLGELNASHLGIEGPPRQAEEATAELGLLFDESYQGPGLKIAEVLKRGPADRRGISLKSGDVILAIDATEILPKTNLAQMLAGKVNETITLWIANHPTDAKIRKRVEVQGASRDSVRDLMYTRWVEQNARRVDELSQGKLGYIHIRSMDEDCLDRFVRDLYSDHLNKDAIVLDVRFNGGGFTHDQVLNYLGGREHTLFRHREGGQGLVMRSFDRKWTRPIALLINNRSYSDAEIFPSAFRAHELGKIIGEPTGAHVIGTTSIRLIDGSRFRVPMIGIYTASGKNMEKEGVQPDILVVPTPDQLAKGIDTQLEKAVEVLRKDVIAWKQAKAPLSPRVGEAKTSAVLPMGTSK